ncbi:copper amine oxidase N-terminal domain-containing protein [Paenibacillus gansuensis]|uniref:Copper amine oxidase N-terminal domain-containing protein n=1 Tax=Paenibacillus gansuensis TaxID=306542 RepID=A0ABW5PH46_9BACL
MKMKKFIAPVLSLSLLVPTLAYAETPPMTRATVSTPAADLRAGLDYLLSEHFVLAVTAMTKAYDGAKDAQAAYDALDQNALDMQPAIASLYGEAGAAEFNRIFRAHNKYTDDLVKAMKAKDAEGIKKAQAQVDGFITEFGAFLGTATGGKLPAKAAQDAVRLHEQQVQETFDEYVEGDFKGAYDTFREGFKTMFTISKALSGAITTQMPEKFMNTKADTKAADLRSTLNSLVSEHVALSVLEMQKQYDGAKDYNALIEAEKGNTADFKGAIQSIYGQAGADQFEKIWVTNHIAAQSDLAEAAKKGDAAAKEQIMKRIDMFSTEFGAFLGTATAENLPTKAAQDALRTHEMQIQGALDKYAAGDYTAAYKTFREAYKFVFGVGQNLGGAIVAQFNDKFQDAPMMPSNPGTPSTPAPGMATVWMKINSKTLKINGKTTMMDTTPFIWSNTTYIPLRYLAEGIGANVSWDGKNTVWVKAGSDTLTFWIGADYMEVNGMKKQIGTKLIADKNGRAAVPLRFITELLGWDVNWNTKDWSVKLTKAM